MPVDEKKSFEYFTVAAKHNLPQAQYHLGVLYRDGNWVVQDKTKSLYWFDKASHQGLPEADLMIQDLAMREPDDVDLYVTNEERIYAY